MTGKTWLAPATGLLFILFLAIHLLIVEAPPAASDASVDEVVSFYVENEDSIFLSSVFQALGGAMFLLFAAQLYKAMRSEGADASAIGMLAGAAVLTVGAALDATINAAGASTAADIDPVAVEALAALFEFDFLVAASGLFVFLISWGAGIIQHGVFPRWSGWVLAIGSLVAITPAWFVALIITAVAVTAASVMLMTSSRQSAQPA